MDGDGEALIDPLSAALRIAGSGLAAQSARLRVVSENMANAQATGQGPGAAPYARKTISFVSELDRASGVQLVRVQGVGVDTSPFPVEHDPGNPAADANGDVRRPNVNMLTEMGDMVWLSVCKEPATPCATARSLSNRSRPCWIVWGSMCGPTPPACAPVTWRRSW